MLHHPNVIRYILYGEHIKKYNDIAAIVIQSPNKYGILENWKDAYNLGSKKNGLLSRLGFGGHR